MQIDASNPFAERTFALRSEMSPPAGSGISLPQKN
jgi:hypothetical protein